MPQDRSISPTDERPFGATTSEDAFLMYEAAGLRLPPVPLEAADELDEFADWLWGTDELPLGSVDDFFAAAKTVGGESQLAFGTTGHGTNSVWLCYWLKLDAVAVYTRFAFGGVYHDNDAAAIRINEVSAMLEELIPLAEATREAGRFRGGSRLIIIHDDLTEHSWQIFGSVPRRACTHPVREALDYLTQPCLNSRLDEAPPI